jgi:hypothetical protein
MPIAEAIRPGALVFLPSQVPSHQKTLALEWRKLFQAQPGHAAFSSTLVTRHGATDVYNPATLTMAEQNFSQANVRSATDSERSLEESLFDARAMAKILTSRISMYLREGWRDKLFYQLDNLLDPDEWDPEDKPLQEQSFDTFLKALCDLQPAKRPGLGLAYSGNLIAGWRGNANGNDRMSLEFAPDGKVKVIGTRFVDDDPVHFSFVANVKSLKTSLIKFNCADWMGCAQA